MLSAKEAVVLDDGTTEFNGSFKNAEADVHSLRNAKAWVGVDIAGGKDRSRREEPRARLIAPYRSLSLPTRPTFGVPSNGPPAI